MKNDLVLIDKIKKGDEEAFKELLKDYHCMIFKIINNISFAQAEYPVDIDSLYQEGSIALYNSVLTYEQDKGASFSSFAYMNIRSKVMTYYKRKCKYRLHERLSLDNSDRTEYSFKAYNYCVSEDPIAYHKEQEFSEFLTNYINNLSSEDRQIIELKKSNYTYKQISEYLKISEKKVDNRLRILKRNIIKRYLSD